MNLIIDQGNTRDKIALFRNGNLLRKQSIQNAGGDEIAAFLAEDKPSRCIISTVTTDDLFKKLHSAFPFPVFKLSVKSPLPLHIKYETPETLGLDRVALAAAAVSQYPGQDCLVVDAGTSLTFDFVDRSGAYHGGAIAPGLQMRYRALHEFTARLPLIEHEPVDDFIGRNTKSSILSGVANGMLQEVKGTIQQYQARFPHMLTVITGGDMPLFEGLSKNSIFAAPDFLLHGLNHILDYHAETH